MIIQMLIISLNEITLPLHTLLTDEEVQYIIKQFKRIITEC